VANPVIKVMAYVAVQHYIYGNTLGQIEKQTGIGYSSLIDAMHQLAKRLKDFPENTEIKSFVEALAPQLANAISLRTLDITDRQFKRQAAKIKDAIINIINSQARHPAIQKIQDIFREKAQRLYHWAEDRTIPADNNLAERELRPLVIARKISFGSQSDAGARTREILMTVLHTLKKRTDDVTTAFRSALDKLAEQGDVNLYKAIFEFDSS